MARIPYIEPDDAEPAVAAIYQEIADHGFDPFNVMKVFANDADFFAGFQAYAGSDLFRRTLAPRYRELAWLRTSQLNSCHY